MFCQVHDTNKRHITQRCVSVQLPAPGCKKFSATNCRVTQPPYASDPLNINKTRSESTCGQLHLHCTTTPAYFPLCYSTATAPRPDGNTPGMRGFRKKKKFVLPTKKKKSAGACSSPGSRGLSRSDARCLLESLSSLPFVHRRAPHRASALGVRLDRLLTRGVSRVLHHRFRKARADQPTLASFCLQCSHRVVKTPSGRSHTHTQPHTQPCS